MMTNRRSSSSLLHSLVALVAAAPEVLHQIQRPIGRLSPADFLPPPLPPAPRPESATTASPLPSTQSSLRRTSTASLRERLATAPSVEALQVLLAEGDRFTKASPRTRRQWAAAAADRVKQLASEQPIAQHPSAKRYGWIDDEQQFPETITPEVQP